MDDIHRAGMNEKIHKNKEPHSTNQEYHGPGYVLGCIARNASIWTPIKRD